MKLYPKFKERIKNERKRAHNYKSASVVPTQLALDLLKRVEQLEGVCDEFGYLPGKLIGKEHLSYKYIFGV